MIKILLADDSSLVRAILRDIFHKAKDFAVVGEAVNGREAVDKTRLLKPDLVVMDLLMPVMDGLAAIEEIMAKCPVPILVLTATLEDREVNDAFGAIKKGALDVMGKPGGIGFVHSDDFDTRLIEKARMLSRIKVIHRHAPRPPFDTFMKAAKPAAAVHRNILAIGASTGGPRAVMSIVKNLPADLRAAVFIVQHIAPGFAGGFTRWLGSESVIRVRLAEEGDEISVGEVLVAPGDYHMVLENGRVKLLGTPPVHCCRPSIDVLFNSLAIDQGERVMGVLLTGMGKDGAVGLRKIRECGGTTIAQDEQTSVVFGMPKEAINLDAADQVLPLSDMPDAIIRQFSGKSR